MPTLFNTFEVADVTPPYTAGLRFDLLGGILSLSHVKVDPSTTRLVAGQYNITLDYCRSSACQRNIPCDQP